MLVSTLKSPNEFLLTTFSASFPQSYPQAIQNLLTKRFFFKVDFNLKESSVDFFFLLELYTKL